MLKKMLLVAALFTGSAAATAAPALPSCGQARPDLKVCLSTWSLPGGSSGAFINLYYTSGETYTLPVSGYNIYPGDLQRGISTYYANGIVRNQTLQFLLALNYGASTLPSWPAPQPVAQLFYAVPYSQTWLLLPGTYTFSFGTNVISPTIAIDPGLPAPVLARDPAAH